MKLLYTVFFIVLGYLLIGNFFKADVHIPDDAIRFRIIASSNDIYDQSIKYKLKKVIDEEFFPIINNVASKDEVKIILEKNMNKLNKIVKETLERENYTKDFKISLGYNYFPDKELFGIRYKEGFYDSLVITLGNGLGENWWCVLFPPLCLIEATESTDVEYKFFVKEILDKYN